MTQIYSSQALSSIISTISSVGQKKSESDISRPPRNQPMVSCCRNFHSYHVSIRIPIILDNPQVHHYSYVAVLSTGILYVQLFNILVYIYICACVYIIMPIHGGYWLSFPHSHISSVAVAGRPMGIETWSKLQPILPASTNRPPPP